MDSSPSPIFTICKNSDLCNVSYLFLTDFSKSVINNHAIGLTPDPNIVFFYVEGESRAILFSMLKTSFQILTTHADLKTYQELTEEKVSVKLPMNYLEQARVVGLKNQRTGAIYGGFTMAYQGSLRCLEQLPEVIRKNHPYLKKYDNQFFEINGLWLNHKKAPDNARLQLYLHCMREASLLTLKGKSKYVYAYCANNQKLRDFYRNFNSIEIYEGEVSPLPGMKYSGPERVEMGCMKRLPITVLRNPLFLVQRSKGKSYQALQATFRKVSEFKGKLAI